MNKKGVLISLLVISLIITVSLGNSESYTSTDILNVSVTINEFVPVLRVNVLEDSIYLENVTKFGESTPKPFNVTNTGNINANIKPQIIENDIFSNLEVGTSQGQGYKKIGNFTGSIEKGDKEDFWIKLNLENYSGNLTGTFSTQVTFLVMSDG